MPSREDLERLLAVLEKVQRRRRIILAGYIIAALLLIVGQVFALYIYGTWETPWRGVVFFVPFGSVGLTLWLFGLWAKRDR